jgi:hypothetical protein
MKHTVLASRIAKLALLLLAPLLLTIPAHAVDCDIAILNGRVMDPETNFDAVRNVCIKGDRIFSITEDALSGSFSTTAYRKNGE